MKYSHIPLFCCLALGVFCGGPCIASSADAMAPKRVVSLNLCADELLLLLADPEQIASLTWLVKDASLSWSAQPAAAYPSNRGLAEEILLLEPDLVLTGEFTTPATVAVLDRLNVPLMRLSLPRTGTAIEQQILEVAEALGQVERGRRVVSQMRRRLEDLPHLAAQSVPLRAALFQPNGLTATADTLVHDALKQAGFVNLAVDRELPKFARLSLETLLHDQPDVLVMSNYAEHLPSLAQELLRHPVLQQSFGASRKVTVPAQAWTCGTPSFVVAVEILRRAAVELVQRREHAS